ncbi:hypothetical protein [Simiduia agarivorans]|uniref:hypothetical protein n=1 Tax=Simiduia agarivorans TaxID=447471 RepID=UPI001182020A|nr:hypothetical protein [Simiduia agarivorans]
MINKESTYWQAEPRFIRILLLGVCRRSHMLAIELIMLAVGGVLLFLGAEAVSVALPLVGAYINAKLMAYIDRQGHW